MFSLLLFFACGDKEKIDTASEENEEVVETSTEEVVEETESVEEASEEGGEE